MPKKRSLLLTRGHTPQKEVLSHGSQSPTSSQSLGSQSLGRGTLSLVSFSLTLGYGGNHAYPANSGLSWPDAMLQTQAEVSIQVHIEGKEIERVDCSKSLGLTIDETLSWSNKDRKHFEENLLRNWRLESSETIYQHTFSYKNPSGLNFERYTQSWAISRRSRPKTAEKYIWFPRTVVLLLIKPTIFCFLHLFVSAFALLLFFATAAVVFYVLVAVESLDPAENPKTSLKSEFTFFQSLIYRGYYYIKSRSSENYFEFCRRLLMRRHPYNVHCKTRPFHVIAAYPANEIYKKVWCTCKVKVKVPSKPILFVSLFVS